MVLSNGRGIDLKFHNMNINKQHLCTEPGFYQDGEFGIRIENLVKIVPANPVNVFKDRKFCTFENLTFVPIQKKM